MSDIALNVIVRPFIVLAFFALAALIAWLIRPLIPEGRIRTALYRKRPLGDWVLLIGWTLATLILFSALWYFDPLR